MCLDLSLCVINPIKMNVSVRQYVEMPQTSSHMSPIRFCVTCLSTSNERKMYLVVDKTFFSSITTIQVPTNSNWRVCWECKAIFENIRKFRMRALKAHQILAKTITTLPTPLTSLVRNNLNDWLSITYKKSVVQLEETPDPLNAKLKEEVHEIDTQLPDAQDPFSLQSELEIEIKQENSTKEEPGRMDIVKCEYDSSDDEPLKTKAKTHLEIMTHQSDDDRDTDNELPTTQNPNSTPQSTISNLQPLVSQPMGQSVLLHSTPQSITTNLKPSVSQPMGQSVLLPIPLSLLPKANTRLLQLPLVSLTSSLPRILPKPDDSTTQRKPQEQETEKPKQSGQKLFKNSPQLAVPEMFRNTEPQKKTVYEIRTLSQEEVDKYRKKRLSDSAYRNWEHFCEKCLGNFARRHLYEQHLKKHEESAGAFVCDVCELRFPTETERDEHKAEHYKMYVCVVCKEEFPAVKALLRHNVMVHEDVLRVCQLCDQRFTTRREFYRHNKTHIDLVKCERCDKFFKRTALNQHIKDIHDAKPFLKCKFCDKVVQGKKNLTSHMYWHRPGQKVEERAYCVPCDATFKSQAMYQYHLNTSMKHRSQDDKVPCPQCGRSFASAWYLKKHILIVHEKREMSQCDICKQMFLCKKNVQRHIIKHHLGSQQRPARNNVCEICGKAFTKKACLEQHRNSHLNIRPYKCEECGATFTYSGARHTHIRLKHRKEARAAKKTTKAAKKTKVPQTKKKT